MVHRPFSRTLGWPLRSAARWLALALAAATPALPAAGAPAGFSTAPDWISHDGAALAWGDVDADGDLDLAVGQGWESIHAAVLYLNVGGTLDVTPVWHSDSDFGTNCLAWGDVDGDGDLDLVCGNEGDSNTLYMNEGGQLSTQRAWSSVETTDCTALAWGDLDGDGDLDLACSYETYGGSGATVYFNDGGLLPAEPGWSSGPTQGTHSLAWGDADEDGDLDLACGNETGATLYLNSQGRLPATPSWSSPPVYVGSVAWADVDGDGDLDLACGASARLVYLNDGGGLGGGTLALPEDCGSLTWGDVDGDGDLDLASAGNHCTIYLNEAGIFGVPNWSLFEGSSHVGFGDMNGDGKLDLAFSGPTVYLNHYGDLGWSTDLPGEYAWDYDLGDLDGDGDLDLACAGNERGSVFLNHDGTLSASPFWVSAPQEVRSVAWGDVDGDGDLDLACGTRGRGGRLYLNEGGTLTESAWTSGSDAAESVSWVDVDLDGDLDLFCGGELFANEGAGLAGSPFWTGGGGSADWADADSDGDLDLACAGWGGGALYLNEGGSLGPAQPWATGIDLRSVAWGDVDGDGAPDLACGTTSGAELHLNEDGQIGGVAWFGRAFDEGNFDVAWGDVDGDGYLDLACAGVIDDGITLYRNHRGQLASGAESVGHGWYNVAWGDLDDDGDLELVSGHHTIDISSGLRAPAFGGNPVRATNHLPNNAAHLRRVRTAEPERNVLRISFEALDVESDPLYVTPAFQFEGDPEWLLADLVGGGHRSGPFASSPTGVAGSFDWDLERFPADRRPVVLRLLVTEIPGRVSTIQHVAPYQKQLGTINPARPLATVAPSLLTFATVTVGDTISASFEIRNVGTEPLVPSDLRCPLPEISFSPAPLPTIPPGGSLAVTAQLAPRLPLAVMGDLVFASNDPLRPVLAVPFAGEILPLSFQSELLRDQSTVAIPLGEAAIVTVSPAAGVRIESGAVFFRPLGSAVPFDARPLSPSGHGFLAVIPGSSVTESGLEYYVQVENSGVFAVDPAGAPDELYRQPVQPASFLAVTPLPNPEGAFPQAQDLRLRLDVTPGTEVLAGLVYFRQGGATVFDSTEVEGTAPVLGAIVPGTAVGARGLEYFARLRTRTTTLTTPAGWPSAPPCALQVRVTGLTEPGVHPGQRYRLLSLPLHFQQDFTGSLADVLSGLGTYDPVHWRCYRYLPAAVGGEPGRNVELSADPALFRPEPGRGFWLISLGAHQAATLQPGFSTSTAGPYPLVLAPGWNQVGNPFAFPVAWEAVQRSGAIEDPVGWDLALGQLGGYSESAVAVLMPFAGYFVYNAAAAAETLWVPPRAAEVELVAAVDHLGLSLERLAAAKRQPTAEGWSLRLSALVAGGAAADGASVLIGVDADALDGRDARDRRRAPAPPGAALQLAIDARDWAERMGLYRTDIRSEATDGHRWDLILHAKEPGAAGDLQPAGADDLPSGLSVVLVDLELGTQIDLRQNSGYQLVFFGPARPYRLALLAGTQTYVEREAAALREIPSAVLLDANSPNPFNPATRIRFGLPAPGPVSLNVYDVRGARVATLLDQRTLPAGYHSVIWDGRDAHGRRAASGVYFSRLAAQGRTLTRKMLLAK